MKYMLLLVCVNALAAQVSGSSEIVAPLQDSVRNFITCQNDNWPVGGRDENRTASLDVGLQLHDNIRFGLTYDMFTDKEPENGPVRQVPSGRVDSNANPIYDHGVYGLRKDSLSLTINYEVTDWLTVGGGIRFNQNLNGKQIQDTWHNAVGAPVLTHYQYENDEATDPLVVLDIRKAYQIQGGPGVYVSGSFAYSHTLESEVGCGIYGSTSDPDYPITLKGWIGLNYLSYMGDSGSEVINDSWDFEDGLGIEAGFSVWIGYFKVVYNPETMSELGEFGFVW